MQPRVDFLMRFCLVFDAFSIYFNVVMRLGLACILDLVIQFSSAFGRAENEGKTDQGQIWGNRTKKCLLIGIWSALSANGWERWLMCSGRGITPPCQNTIAHWIVSTKAPPQLQFFFLTASWVQQKKKTCCVLGFSQNQKLLLFTATNKSKLNEPPTLCTD